MFTEVSVLVDVLNITKEKRYLAIDPVSCDPPEPRPLVVLLQKKKVWNNYWEIYMYFENSRTEHVYYHTYKCTLIYWKYTVVHIVISWGYKSEIH